ncbi:MAG: hypothetical protein Q8M88_12420 [Phenylobacterium sp.]|uniref:LytR C-terminal domain-containing protein n=1 Tax=Phenylobacterium sp. TaxID=1871053 RepID=UPI002736EDA7|nr:LytR C-terminal domain-containing protein [Phenylobacterium sp.]MDP3175227.1 hypothetical protein [Phenylobacterium sp.]
MALGLGLGGCTSIPKAWSWLQPEKTVAVRSIVTPTTFGAQTSIDRAYEAASREIEARRYGRALELLQYARDVAPSDVRVLNALGVVYDKLGRFELSARYYADALKSEPGSPIVLANVKYSTLLQGRYLALQEDAGGLVAVAQPATPPAPILAAAAPGLHLAQSVITPRTAPLLVGRRLNIVAGIAAADSATRLRDQLVARGWSVAREIETVRAPQVHSLIEFPAQHREAALALARTLPFEARLVDCKSTCQGLVIVLGGTMRWKS